MNKKSKSTALDIVQTKESILNATEGVKFDKGKPKMSLVPILALEEVAKVMTYGATKYAEYNWMNGFDWTRLIDAAMRHMSAFNRGENLDPETGLSHLAHAACCAMMLFDITQIYPERDTRWNGWKQFTKKKILEKNTVLEKNKAKVRSKHKNKN